MRRRNNGKTITIQKNDGTVVVVDNRWIATYCAYFTMLLMCHVNVEVVSFIEAVKYLFKYIFKGHDAATVELAEEGKIVYDEIQKHIDGRYVSLFLNILNF